MLFDSPAYIIFLILVVASYWRLGHRRQNVFLLAVSYFFYGWWDYRFLLLMICSTLLDFWIAQKLGPESKVRPRRTWFLASVIINFTILGVFKYFNFFVGSFTGLLTSLGVHNIPLPLIRIILPPGISFYTFQEIAYIVDVYKGRIQPSRSFVEYGLFISLFPHLIAGPIQRPSHLLPQVQKERFFDAGKFFDGLMLIVMGLFRKCVIADNCALLANAAFDGRLGTPTLWTVLIGAYAFAWQIYGDFSGYSDIARGSAQLLGFHFMVNFRQPYLAQSCQDFWRRWHISLSTWLRDYLYIPMGGSAEGVRKTYRNLLVTMLLGGLWHGANWTFVIWGGMHGMALALERFFRSLRELAANETVAWVWVWTKRVAIFNFVCLTWVFFRATSFRAAVVYLKGLGAVTWRQEYIPLVTLLCVYSIPLFVLDLMMEHAESEYPLAHSALPVRTAFACASLVALAFFSGNNPNAFIYFQF